MKDWCEGILRLTASQSNLSSSVSSPANNSISICCAFDRRHFHINLLSITSDWGQSPLSTKPTASFSLSCWVSARGRHARWGHRLHHQLRSEIGANNFKPTSQHNTRDTQRYIRDQPCLKHRSPGGCRCSANAGLNLHMSRKCALSFRTRVKKGQFS